MKNLVSELRRFGRTDGQGACLTEAVSIFAGETFSSWPECLDQDLTWLCRSINDAIESDAERDSLLRYVPLLVATRDDGRARQRNEKMVAWAQARLDEFPPTVRAKDGLAWASLNDAIHVAELYAARKSGSGGDVGFEIGSVVGAMENLGLPISLAAMTELLDDLLVDTLPPGWRREEAATTSQAAPVPA